MKKILSILSTISLSTIISTNIIACNIPNKNNQNNIPNKPIDKLIKTEYKPQQPPKNSNGKLIDYPASKTITHNLFKNPDNKGYVVNKFITQEGNIIKKFKFTNDTKLVKKSDYDEFTGEYKFKDYEGLPNELIGYHRYIYQGNGINEPLLPEINNSGKITNGNEKIETN